MNKYLKNLIILVIFLSFLEPFSILANSLEDPQIRIRNYVLPLGQTVNLDDQGDLKMTFVNLSSQEEEACPVKAELSIIDKGKTENIYICKKETKSLRTDRLIIQFLKSNPDNWAKFQITTKSFSSLKNPLPNEEKILVEDSVSQEIIEKLNIEEIEIELKDPDNLIYQIVGKRNVKLFGIIKTKITVRADIDAKTGSIENVKESWWKFLVW